MTTPWRENSTVYKHVLWVFQIKAKLKWLTSWGVKTITPWKETKTQVVSVTNQNNSLSGGVKVETPWRESSLYMSSECHKKSIITHLLEVTMLQHHEEKVIQIVAQRQTRVVSISNQHKVKITHFLKSWGCTHRKEKVIRIVTIVSVTN